MAEYRGLSVKVPIKFSEKAQKDLYETCVAYKELAEMRGAENERLRELAKGMYGLLATLDAILGNHDACETPRPLIFSEDKSFKDVMRELGVEVD